MICRKCNTENEAGAKFCHLCGSPLQAGQQPSQSGDGVASMVLGIVSIVLCCVPVVPTICAIIAIILSRRVTKAGKSSGCNTAGLVCGIIGLCFSVLYLIYWIFFVVLGLITASLTTVDFRL